MYNLDSFYQHNTELLENHYPGINLSTLKRYFKDAPHVTWSNSLQQDLLKGVPLEYIFKQKFFWDSFFYVDERVLIPRMESEILVQEVLSQIKEGDDICEIGVGSGALFLSVAKEVANLNIVATDICEKALNVANINLYRMGFGLKSKNIELVKTDRLDGIEKKFDFILTNPPYIKKSDKTHVHAKVHEFEPHTALYLEDQEYEEWFKLLFDQSYHCLKESGRFMMEGHEFHLEDLKELCQLSGFKNVELKQDLTSRDRFLIASK